MAAIAITAMVIVVLELSPVSDWVYRHGRRHAGEPDLPKELGSEREGRGLPS